MCTSARNWTEKEKKFKPWENIHTRRLYFFINCVKRTGSPLLTYRKNANISSVCRIFELNDHTSGDAVYGWGRRSSVRCRWTVAAATVTATNAHILAHEDTLQNGYFQFVLLAHFMRFFFSIASTSIAPKNSLITTLFDSGLENKTN